MYSVALLRLASASWKEGTIIGCVLSVLFYHNVNFDLFNVLYNIVLKSCYPVI